MTVAPRQIALVPTGLVIEIPRGYFLGIFARSSTPLKRGLMVANGVGVIDPDYAGPEMHAAVKRHVLEHVREPALIVFFIDRTGLHREPQHHAVLRLAVLANEIRQAVGQLAGPDCRVQRQ